LSIASAGSIASQLALTAAGIRFETLPGVVVDRAIRVVIDTLAVAIAGAADPFCRAYLTSLGSLGIGGSSSTVGSTHYLGAELAAHMNALPTTVLQMDEGHRTSGGHPGIHVVPAALAVGEEVRADGRDLLVAVVAGYEVAARIGLALRPLPEDVHPNGTAGTFGAAVAAATLWGADESRLLVLLDATASLPLRPRISAAFDGSSVLHLYAALGAQEGVTMARAVSHGATCTEGAFDHYLSTFSGRGGAPWAGAGFELLQSYFKFYPACGHAHTAIEALEELLATASFSPHDIERIELHAYRMATLLADQHPRSDLAARFSIPFCLARRVAVGPLDASYFTDKDLIDPATVGLMSRTTVSHDPLLESGYPAGRPVRLRLTLRDGTVLTAERRTSRGDFGRAEPESVWRRKIHDLVGGERARRLLAFADAPPSTWGAADIGAAIRGAAADS
jgi:2-methylcitrate dehydratase PrpD